MQPVTPPRKLSTQQKPRIALSTPPTPFFKQSSEKISKPQLSPVKHSRQNHLTTPNPTPRHRKKNTAASGVLLGDAFNFHSATRTLFPPTPSTVGSGRVKDLVFKSPSKHRVAESPSLTFCDLGLEIPQEKMVVAKRKLTFNVESDGDEEVEDVTPLTPQGKVISRELAQKWIDEVPEGGEDDEVDIRQAKPSNPFVTEDGGMKEFVLKKPSRPLDFVEYVNKKGEKTVKKAGSLDTMDDESPRRGRVSKQNNLAGDLKKASPFQVYHDK